MLLVKNKVVPNPQIQKVKSSLSQPKIMKVYPKNASNSPEKDLPAEKNPSESNRIVGRRVAIKKIKSSRRSRQENSSSIHPIPEPQKNHKQKLKSKFENEKVSQLKLSLNEQLANLNDSRLSLLQSNSERVPQSSGRPLYHRMRSQSRSFNAFRFAYDTKMEEFDAKNFKEEILGSEIRQEEVTDILLQINNRFILKDSSSLKKLRKQIKFSIWVNAVLTPLLILAVAIKRSIWTFLPQGNFFLKKINFFSRFDNSSYYNSVPSLLLQVGEAKISVQGGKEPSSDREVPGHYQQGQV